MDDQKINLLQPQRYPLTPPQKTKAKWAVFLILGAVIMGLLLLRNYNMMNTWPSSPSDYDPVTLKPKKIGFLQTVRNFIFKSDNVMIGQSEDRINILLLGIGGLGHDGPFLSDTNIILSIKPSTKEVSMVSVPRDLAVKIPGHGVRKINNANAFGEAEAAGGGGEYARKIFEETFSISIPYYARVDFAAFQEIIDAIGGIEVDVQRSFTDTAYPGPNDSYRTVSFQAGLQQMSGEQALIFTRSRHGSNGEGSDFARAKRQQLMLTAFKKKLLTSETFLNPMTLQRVISSLSKHVETNIDFGQIMFLASLGKEIQNDEIKTLVLNDAPTGFLKPITGEGGAYLLIPKTGNFSEIKDAINNIFEATSTPTTASASALATGQIQPKQTPASMAIPNASIEIQNGTWQAGLAALKKQQLETKGLFISSVGNSAKRPISITTIYIVNSNVPNTTVGTLSKELNASSSTDLPEWLALTYNEATTTSRSKPDIIVILGEDAI
ncbi:MAG: LCP family protein [Candidatus Magasanikbacteria bacterium]|nr:LCP family protein [Candidatus Magasanikbacteria bacterium]